MFEGYQLYAGLILSAISSYWVYTNATSRKMSRVWMWALLTFLVPIIGIPLYALYIIFFGKPVKKK